MNTYICINENGITDPKEVLDNIHKEFIAILKQNESKFRYSDGMDLSLCKIDLLTGKMVFSGAKRPVYIIGEKQEMEIIKGEKKSIGLPW